MSRGRSHRFSGWTGAALVAVLLAGCKPEATAAPGPAAPKPALTITVAPVEARTWPLVLEVHGAIAAWREARISARIGGLPLVDLTADVGDRVRRGQRLARFDDRTVRAELAQARATLAQAAANVRQASANRLRKLGLKGTSAVSEHDVLLAQTQFEAAEAQRALAEAQVTAQEIRLENCEVVAVEDGVISASEAALGQVAQAGTDLFRLIVGERLEWRAELNAGQLPRAEPGQPVRLTLPDGSDADGRVRQLAPALDNASRLGLAYVDLAPGSGARAGMYATGRIALAQTAALVVPAEAVVLRDGRGSVFRVGDDDRVSRIAVETGRRDGDWIEIVQGLRAGEVVAVRGAGFLGDGDRVLRTDGDRVLRTQADDHGTPP